MRIKTRPRSDCMDRISRQFTFWRQPQSQRGPGYSRPQSLPMTMHQQHILSSTANCAPSSRPVKNQSKVVNTVGSGILAWLAHCGTETAHSTAALELSVAPSNASTKAYTVDPYSDSRNDLGCDWDTHSRTHSLSLYAAM